MITSKSVAALAMAGALAFTSSAMADGYGRGSIKDAPYIAPFSWTGFYVGANVGYNFGDSDPVSVTPANSATANYWNPSINARSQPNSIGVDRDGFIGGVHAGYNVQSGTLVYGIEADFSWLGGDSGTTVLTPAQGLFLANNSTATHELDWLGTVRGRLGLLLQPQLLAYVTGGLAYGNVNTGFSARFPADAFAGSTSKTEIGWTVGGGLEWALNRNWLIRGEYLYYDLGSTDFTTVGSLNASGRGTFIGSADTTGHIARAGISYKF